MTGALRPSVGSLHVAVPKKLAAHFRAEAARRKVRPYVLINATLQKIADDNLLDALLDGDNPADLAPGHVLLLNGMSRLQGAILYLMGQHFLVKGAMPLQRADVRRALPPRSDSNIQKAFIALLRRGLVERRECTSTSWPVYGLTEAGVALAQLLGEFDGSDAAQDQFKGGNEHERSD